MFHGKHQKVSAYDPECSITSKVAADMVNTQVFDQEKSLTLEQVTDEFRHSWDEDFPVYDWNNWSKLSKEEQKIEEKKCTAACDAIASRKAKAFFAKHKGKFLAKVSFGDHDGEPFGTMEHGNAWDEIEHVQFSHH